MQRDHFALATYIKQLELFIYLLHPAGVVNLSSASGLGFFVNGAVAG